MKYLLIFSIIFFSQDSGAKVGEKMLNCGKAVKRAWEKRMRESFPSSKCEVRCANIKEIEHDEYSVDRFHDKEIIFIPYQHKIDFYNVAYDSTTDAHSSQTSKFLHLFHKECLGPTTRSAAYDANNIYKFKGKSFYCHDHRYSLFSSSGQVASVCADFETSIEYYFKEITRSQFLARMRDYMESLIK